MNTCTIEIKGKEYTFCLTREAIKWLEARGMNFGELDKKMFTYVDLFWVAGLITKHGELTELEAHQLMIDYANADAEKEEDKGDVMEVISFLIEEYTNFVYALTDTKSNSKKKKAKIVKG
ncbi:MAG: hypothetical protein HFH45_01360 [Bacilli bacterium]|nr:hypothetical protein [Bacilli bacterium]